MALTKEQTDRFAEVNGIRIHYNEAGSGPAFICTHGGGPGANAWDNTKLAFEEFAKHFRIILMDMPGFGESQKDVNRHDVPLDIFAAKVTHDFMDKLGIDRAHLYGSSAFAPATLRFGLEYPDRIGKIVFQSSGIAHIGQGTPPIGIQAIGKLAEDPTRDNMRRVMELFFPRPGFVTEEMIEARFRSATTPGMLEGRRAMAASSNSDLRELVNDLKAQVLVTWGFNDNMVLVDGLPEVLKHLPDAQAHIWGPPTGHFVMTEHPEEYARVVIDFLTH